MSRNSWRFEYQMMIYFVLWLGEPRAIMARLRSACLCIHLQWCSLNMGDDCIQINLFAEFRKWWDSVWPSLCRVWSLEQFLSLLSPCIVEALSVKWAITKWGPHLSLIRCVSCVSWLLSVLSFTYPSLRFTWLCLTDARKHRSRVIGLLWALLFRSCVWWK